MSSLPVSNEKAMLRLRRSVTSVRLPVLLRWALGTLLALLLGVPGFAAPARHWAGRLDAIVLPIVSAGPPSATVVLVRVEARDVYRRAFGKADLEHDVAATPETIFDIGSVSKSLTAQAVLRLAAAGRLSLDDRVGRWLPDFHGPAGQATIRQLLVHTSGIPSYTDAPELRDEGLGFNREEVLSLFRDAPLLFPGGSEWSYSNSGYFLLGLIVEKVTGQPFDQALAALVTRPLGLRHTALNLRDPVVPGRARPYAARTGGEIVNAVPLDATVPFSAGAIRSTADDLARFIEALFDRRFESSAAGRLTFEPGRLSNGRSTSYLQSGLWDRPLDGHRRVHHSGSYPGFEAHLAYLPEKRATIVILRNSNGFPDHPERVGTKIARALLGTSRVLPPDRPLTEAEAARFSGRYAFADRAQPIREAVLAWRDGAMSLERRSRAEPSTIRLRHLGGGRFVSEINDEVEARVEGDGTRLTLTSYGVSTSGTRVR